MGRVEHMQTLQCCVASVCISLICIAKRSLSLPPSLYHLSKLYLMFPPLSCSPSASLHPLPTRRVVVLLGSRISPSEHNTETHKLFSPVSLYSSSVCHSKYWQCKQRPPLLLLRPHLNVVQPLLPSSLGKHGTPSVHQHLPPKLLNDCLVSIGLLAVASRSLTMPKKCRQSVHLRKVGPSGDSSCASI